MSRATSRRSRRCSTRLDGWRCCSRRISLLAWARVRGDANVSPVRWARARRNASCLAVGSTASSGWLGSSTTRRPPDRPANARARFRPAGLDPATRQRETWRGGLLVGRAASGVLETHHPEARRRPPPGLLPRVDAATPPECLVDANFVLPHGHYPP